MKEFTAAAALYARLQVWEEKNIRSLNKCLAKIIRISMIVLKSKASKFFCENSRSAVGMTMTMKRLKITFVFISQPNWINFLPFALAFFFPSQSHNHLSMTEQLCKQKVLNKWRILCRNLIFAVHLLLKIHKIQSVYEKYFGKLFSRQRMFHFKLKRTTNSQINLTQNEIHSTTV